MGHSHGPHSHTHSHRPKKRDVPVAPKVEVTPEKMELAPPPLASDPAALAPGEIKIELQGYDKDILRNLIKQHDAGLTKLGQLTLEILATAAVVQNNRTAQQQRLIDIVGAHGLDPNDGVWNLDYATLTLTKKA